RCTARLPADCCGPEQLHTSEDFSEVSDSCARPCEGPIFAGGVLDTAGSLLVTLGFQRFVVMTEVGNRGITPFFQKLLSDRAEQMCHRDRLILRGGAECGIQGDVSDITSSERELCRHKIDIDITAQGRLRWKHSVPEPFAIGGIRQRKAHDVMHAPCKCV